MPELPEVEHVARSLQTLVAGQRISAAKLSLPRLAPELTPRKFAGLLSDKTINFVHRRGKHLLFDLSNGLTLITHLRMTGSFALLTPDSTDPKHTHAVFYLGDELRLVFTDQRQFGLMKIVKTVKLFETPELRDLAPEPFSDEFSPEYVFRALKTSKRPVKNLLLDQTKFCGLGNIYAAEALHLARIDPRREAVKISRPKAEFLHSSIRQVLQTAIDHSLSLTPDPENLEETYSSRNSWRVYDREGEPCGTCGSPIRRITQGGRSTFYCSKCQR